MKPITIYNTVNRRKELFVPLSPPVVQFYTCGVTVYDLSHIGHARVYVTTDVIRRILSAAGYQVNYVQNFTDIDDKIIKRANESGVSTSHLTAQFIDAYFEDMGRLGIVPADSYPKATDYLPQMIAMIETLISKGHAYLSEAGDVWFSVGTFTDYGKLSKKKLEDLVAGHRVDVTEGKRSPSDFVLWKSAKLGEPFWASPWGNGRPGWHIECSAMAIDQLGPTIDIHAGGEDLVFPHHENEICQSEAATGHPFVRYWVHNGFVTIRDEKMSKSLNNFFTIRDILTEVSGLALRFFLMRSHYRTPLQFSVEGVKEAAVALEKLHNTVAVHRDSNAPDHGVAGELARMNDSFWTSITDDFNVAEGIGFVFEMARLINISGANSGVLSSALDTLGLLPPREEAVMPDGLQAMLDARWTAKVSRDFAAADQLRQRLIDDFGVVIEDSKDGYRWKYKGG